MKKLLFLILICGGSYYYLHHNHLFDSNDKSSYLVEFNSFITRLDSTSAGFNDADWKSAEVEFTHLKSQAFGKYISEMSTNEKSTIDKLIGNYYALKVKWTKNQAGDNLKHLLNQAQGLVEGISKN